MSPVDPASDTGLYLQAPGRHPHLAAAAAHGRSAVVDGWLYNRDELGKELGLDPAAGEATLVLNAYLRWGEEFLSRLLGAYALCLWDPTLGTAIGARDALGAYPLFYAQREGATFFATSAESLRHHPSIPADISRGALAAHLLDWNRDIGETVYAHIKRVPPGHKLTVKAPGDAGAPERYWFPLPEGRVDWAGPEELEQFPSLMKQAIGRLLQRGRPGIYLSGGLDSGSIALFATDYLRDQQRDPLQAFSLVFDDEEANEAHFQRGLADTLGLEQTLLSIGGEADLAEAFFASLELNRTWPHPLASTFRSVYLPLGARAAAAGCEVILNGDGGDEWLAIHHSLAADLIVGRDLARLQALTATVASTHGYSRGRAARHVIWRHGLKLALIETLARSFGTIAPMPLARRRRRLTAAAMPSWLAPDPELRGELVDRAERANARASHSHYRRELVDETLEHPLTVIYMEESFEESRRIGVPILKPFYDPDLVRFLARLPPDLRSQGGRFKGLLVTPLHERAPHLGYDRQQKPYGTGFFARTVMEGLKRSSRDDDGVGTLASMGIVDSAIVGASISKILAKGTLTNPKSLWTVLCAEHWARAR